MDDVADPAMRDAAREVRALIAAREDSRELVMMGAYRAGADPVLDRALHHTARIDDFLHQARGEAIGLAQSIAQLQDLAQATRTIDAPGADDA